MSTDTMIRVEIIPERTPDGTTWLVVPYYRLPSGVTVSVPPDRGFPTEGEAVAEVERILSRSTDE